MPERKLWKLGLSATVTILLAILAAVFQRAINEMEPTIYQFILSFVIILIALGALAWIVVAFFMAWLREGHAPQKNMEQIEPITNQGPRYFMPAATTEEPSKKAISDRVVDIVDVLEDGAIFGKQFEHCVIRGPATLFAEGVGEHNREQPFSCGLWNIPPGQRFESQEELGDNNTYKLRDSFFQNCDFRDVKFRLLSRVINSIEPPKPSAPNTSTKPQRTDPPENSGE